MSTYSLGFTPFATPLKAINFNISCYKKGEHFDRDTYLISTEGARTVVGFRQKRGSLTLVTPCGQELPWSDQTDPKWLIQELRPHQLSQGRTNWMLFTEDMRRDVQDCLQTVWYMSPKEMGTKCDKHLMLLPDGHCLFEG